MLIFDHIIDIHDERPGPANALFGDIFLKKMKKSTNLKFLYTKRMLALKL